MKTVPLVGAAAEAAATVEVTEAVAEVAVEAVAVAAAIATVEAKEAVEAAKGIATATAGRLSPNEHTRNLTEIFSNRLHALGAPAADWSQVFFLSVRQCLPCACAGPTLVNSRRPDGEHDGEKDQCTQDARKHPRGQAFVWCGRCGRIREGFRGR